MPILATVILDSGCFLPVPESKGDYTRGDYTRVGYFGSDKSVPDICVKADGVDLNYSEPLNLGEKCEIQIRHVEANGTVKKGVFGSIDFQDRLLHLEDLYGKDDIPDVDPDKFDCIIQFNSGLFCPAMVKPRDFKRFSRQAIGASALPIEKKSVYKPIAHNIYVHFKLEDGDTLQFSRGGTVFWSSERAGAKQRLDIDIIADNSTAEKFYCMALKVERDSYWLPNQGDPPPMCSQPPCEPRRTSSL